MKKVFFMFLVILLLFSNAVFGESISGVIKDRNESVVTGVQVYVYAYDLTGSGESTHIAQSAPVGSTTSSSVDGTWTISGLADSDPVFVIYMYYGSIGAYSKLSGAEFMTPE